MRSTRDTLDDLGHADDPRLLVFNKIDQTPEGVLERLRTEYPEAVFLSAIDPKQAGLLEERVRTGLRATQSADLPVPAAVSMRPVWALESGSDS